MGVAVASIRAADELLVPYEPSAVYALLADVAGWERWWPWFASVHVVLTTGDVVGSNLEVSPLAGYDFQCRIEQVTPGESLRIRYHAGPYAGIGEWTLAASEGGTRIRYAVDLTTSHPVLGAIGQVVDLGLAHSLLMRAVLAGLRRALDGQHDYPRIVARARALPADAPAERR